MGARTYVGAIIFVSICSAVAHTTSPPADAFECPSTYTSLGSSCYRVSELRPASTCQIACTPYGQACVRSLAENSLIHSRFNKAEGLVLGLADLDDDRTFVWSSCPSNNFTDNFHPNEPNNYLDHRPESCVAMMGPTNPFLLTGLYVSGAWNDLNCTTELRCLCEAPLVSLSSGPLTGLLFNNTVAAVAQASASDVLETLDNLKTQFNQSLNIAAEDLLALSDITKVALAKATASSDPEVLKNMTVASYALVDGFISKDQSTLSQLQPQAANEIRLQLENATLQMAKAGLSHTETLNNFNFKSFPIIDPSEVVSFTVGRESVTLPGSATSTPATAAIAIIYDDAWLFGSEEVDTKVVSLTLDTDTSALTAPVKVSFGVDIPSSIELTADLYECRYWDEEQQLWLADGCELFSLSYDQLVCSCIHLTNFAGMLSRNTDLSQSHTDNINLLSTLVITMSVLLLSTVIIGLIVCHKTEWFGRPQVKLYDLTCHDLRCTRKSRFRSALPCLGA